MSQSTDDLTRSELRAIRGHYRRRVWTAFLVPALVAAALGWLLFQDQDANSGEPSQAAPRTTVSGPITNEVVSENRWDKTTKVGLAGADRFDKQAEVYKKAATTCE
jgi:hypothetical protein